MNIQDLETKYKELGAEIERLKRQPEGVWEPTVGGVCWIVDWGGDVRRLNTRNIYMSAVTHHNGFKTEVLAKKASELQLRSNLVIQACLNLDPEFEPDWNDASQHKYGFRYWHFNSDFGENPRWIHYKLGMGDSSAAYVSTQEIADKVLDYLNRQELK